MKSLKCVLFDFDNTLVDRQLSAYHTYTKMVKRDFPDMNKNESEKIVMKLLEWDGEGHIPKKKVFTEYMNTYDIQGHTWQQYNEF